jgi:hypothetical protein
MRSFGRFGSAFERNFAKNLDVFKTAYDVLSDVCQGHH